MAEREFNDEYNEFRRYRGKGGALQWNEGHS